VDVHESPGGSERVVRILDVTAEVTLRQEQWAFQSMVSHKLRTPLNGLFGTLDFLRDDTALPADERRELSALALQSSERLRDTVDAILEHVTVLHLSSSRSAALEVSSVAGLAEGIAAGLDLAPPAVTISDALRGRTLRISTVAAECILRELLDNAKKFHPGSRPAVQVAVLAASPGQARVEVSDDGPGIPASRLARVWAAYYQGEKDFTGEVQGMGLGLSTVASLVWATGGQCRLYNRARSERTGSAADGSGLTVEITLPLEG
jgi:signal transduction histidine kinase